MSQAPITPATPRDRWHLRSLLLTGWITFVLLVFGIGAWAAVTKIAGAVVGSGALEVQGNRQVIQHPTGGVIKAIHARDGDEVVAGQVLIEMEGDGLRPELDTVEGQWFEIVARKSRLHAERDGLDTITFDDELIDRAETDPKIVELMAAQRQQFEARRKLQGEETAQLDEQQAQIAKQNEGLVALAAATERQAELVQREIDAQQTLHDKGLTEMTRLLTPQRELARLRGHRGPGRVLARREPRQDRRARDREGAADLEGARGGDHRAARPRVPRDRAAREAAAR